jgi:hypothetical protein
VRILDIPSRNKVVDFLHGIDINIPDRIKKFSTHDPVLFGERPELQDMLTAFYFYIGCPFDLKGEKSWWHGSVWHYDICMGVAPKSPGLDIFVLAVCLICFGVATPPEDTTPPANAVVDDLAGIRPRRARPQPPAKPADMLTTILITLFGKDAEKVRGIFETWTGYAQMLGAVNDKWESDLEAYKHERAVQLYWASLRTQKAQNSMSNGRCASHYFPLFTEVASRQTGMKGDLWVFSTRATEAKGGRFKRIKRKVYARLQPQLPLLTAAPH